MEDKICPLSFTRSWEDGSAGQVESCHGPRCAWWVDAYTTEHVTVSGCALEILARKNAEGLVIV